MTTTAARGSAPLSILLAVVLATLIAIPFVLRPASATTATGTPTLIIISPHNEQIRLEFAGAFKAWHQREYGEPAAIDFRRPGGTSEIRAQLMAIYESAAKRGNILPDGAMAEGITMPYDLCFGGGTYEHGLLKRGVTVPIGDENVRIPISAPIEFDQATLDDWYGENRIGVSTLYDPDRYWFGLATSSFGVLCNLDALARQGIEIPQRWSDLADPDFMGLLALGDPRQSGSVATTYESILNNYGWDEGWRILRAMGANTRYFAAESKKIVLDVSHGDAAVGVSIDFYGRYQAQAVIPPGGSAADSRLRFVEPASMVFVDPDPISLLRGAPHPELARRFVEFCLSDEGQALWQLPARSKLAQDPGIGPEQYELRRMPIRREFYAKYRDRFIDDINPFEIASEAPSRGWRSMIGPIMGAAIIDVHEEQRRAWKAMTRARESGASPGVVAGLEELFFAMPTHVKADGEAVPFDEAHYGEIRQEWRDRDRAAELSIDYANQFRRNYREVIRRAGEMAGSRD
ncbi:MAG: extracellular solute-binding protein [Phycisphaeraceae bacterium]|nr:extracellular solute-binding protein [Phycisphaeraceae bacterium]MCB9848388.1 extracellular solute-binding protein [Phycisphaeraceae bacterium]